jgi:alpha,alpha-trehalase
MNRILPAALLLMGCVFLDPLLYCQTVVNKLHMKKDPQPPDKVYGQLFTDVEMLRIFSDSKTFADCLPKGDPRVIVAEYLQTRQNPGFSLKQFVANHFTEPAGTASGSSASPVPSGKAANYHADKNEPVKDHIRALWDVLKRSSDKDIEGSSLLPLPYPYIVPGGRFHEIYYWDSYFTMLGLEQSGDYGMITNMVNNFAYMLDQYGHIPNGNRTYYLSRSQPPFFSMMVELLAQKYGDSIYAQYQKALQEEYDYYTDKTAPTHHVVQMPDGSLLTRYYDQSASPRQESFYEDSILGRDTKGDRLALYRNLRSCAETGWDFSSRWFADGQNLSTIRTIDLVPVDLNGLMYHLELTLAKSYQQTGNSDRSHWYTDAAEKRKRAINRYCWNPREQWYYDYDLTVGAPGKEKTIAGMSPFFFRIAPADNISATGVLEKDFIKAGGVLTTLTNTGQQWDAPNGWAPLQWMTIKGLENYGQHALARDIATRWAKLNIRVFHSTGKLMEKYNVVDAGLIGGGGEYPSQDGFGWTNGVLLKLMDTYGIGE